MGLKSSARLLQAWGAAIRRAGLASQTISTLNITHGGYRSRYPESILPVLPHHGQQQPDCIQPLHQLQPKPSLSKVAFAPAHVPHPWLGYHNPAWRTLCLEHVGLIREHLLPIAAAQGRFSLPASCKGANFIYIGCLQHGYQESCSSELLQWGDKGQFSEASQTWGNTRLLWLAHPKARGSVR